MHDKEAAFLQTLEQISDERRRETATSAWDGLKAQYASDLEALESRHAYEQSMLLVQIHKLVEPEEIEPDPTN